ncbi:flagellar assembly protein H domain protein, partial [Ancylostoma caninum]
LVSIAVTVVYSKGPVFVEELEQLVENEEKKTELRKLAEDMSMIRSEKAMQLDTILSELPEDVQHEYKKKVDEENTKMRSELMSQKTQADKWGYPDILAKIMAIHSDMSISDSHAEKLEEELMESLTPHQKQYYDEFRAGSEGVEEDSTCETSFAVTILLSICVFIFC